MAFVKITLYITLCFSLLFISSCTVIKNYPQGKPFVYQANVHVKGDLNDAGRKDLELQLTNQFDDSIKVRSAAKLIGWDNAIGGFIPQFFYTLQNRPTPFDSLDAEKSVQFMKDYLHSLGYFRDTAYYTVKIDTALQGKQLKATIDFYVRPNIVTKLDSISYRLNADTGLLSARQQQAFDTIQKITVSNLKETLIKKGDPFSKFKLSAERDRLADLYRNNGYLRFSEEELLVLWDTVGIELLAPNIDPIEQVQRLAERRANPVADIEFRLRDNPDSTRITRYYVGNVTIYPEFTNDTATKYIYTDSIGKYVVRHNYHLFKNKIFPDWIFLNPGDLYRQINYLKTQNKFNALNAWRIISIQQKPRNGQDTADFDIRLTPARKYAFNTNIEVSRNQGSITIAQGNLIGLGFTAGVQNRNFRRGANQSSFTFRFGTELNATVKDLIQSRQIAVGYNLQIPRLVPKFMRRFSKAKENTTASILSLNAGRTDRKDYFNLTSLTASWGYQFNWANKSFGFRLPNIEYNYLRRGDSLEALIAKNASYKYIFNTGVILSLPINYSAARTRGNMSRLFTANLEVAGIPSLLRNTFATNFYRFLRADLELRQNHKIGRNAIAWRAFIGAGIGLPFSRFDSANQFLPFFRQYFAGGPNSMRAWSVRKLGPGSTIKSFGKTDAPDRFGDMRFEINGEYRTHLFNYGVIGVQTAFYIDAGNVWFLRKNDDFPDGEFRFSKLWKDLAIGTGTGLRIDLSTFLKIRLDYAFKVKNPTPDISSADSQNKWFYGWKLLNGQVQLGIDYPF